MNTEQIEIKSIFLDLENPRHEPYQSQEEVIDYLCKNEHIYALAQDIVEVGINPLEVMAIIPNSVQQHNGKTYIAAEGNRRLCALKLLHDPELAPTDDRKNFKTLSKLWTPFSTIPSIIFENRESVREWLGRIHGGLQNGIGRKHWNPEQKTRFTGDIKNLMAQQLLDYAEQKGMIAKKERANKISIVQRFISNPLFKDALGIDTSKDNELQRTRPVHDFDIVLKKFVDDLKTKEINTRFNSPEIKGYSHNLRSIEGVGNETSPPQPLNAPDKENNSINPSQKPKPPNKPRNLNNRTETESALYKLGNYKLSSIYNSLHRLGVLDHCPLLTIGVWTLFETLTALNGRNADTDFVAFLSVQKLEELGLGNKVKTKALRQCLRRISENGNTTKHHQHSASFNGQQLVNDFDALHPLIQALATDCTSQK